MSLPFVNVDTARLRAAGALLGLVAALTVAACGGDDGEAQQTTAPAVTGADTTDAEKAPGTEAPEDEPSDDPVSDRTAIALTLEAVLTGDDPRQVCEELVTDRYVRKAYGGVQGCAGAQDNAKPARRVRVSGVVVQPDSLAQASARPKGGIYNRERLRAVLVLDDGLWKLDSLRSNVPVGP